MLDYLDHLDAQQFATLYHSGQFYGEHPYTYHLSQVAEDFEHGSLLWQVAWLHDTLEDTEATYEELEHHFGPTVAEAVELLTKKPELTYFSNIQRIIDSGNYTALLVKLNDNSSNYKATGEDGLKRRYSKSIEMLTEALDHEYPV